MSAAEALPDGWELVKLSDVGTFKSGSGFPLNAQGKTSGRYPFFKVSDFSNDGNERSLNGANHYIDEDDRRRIGARVFPAGTIAFAKIGAAIFLERKRLVDQESCLDNNMAGYILQDGRVSRDLVLANLQQFSLGRLVASTALPAIGSGELKSISFPMPSSSAEQQAIAAALSDADGVVAGLERVIAKKRLIKQGAMQDLLTARRRLPGFSGEWELKRIGAALTVRHGRSQKGVEDPNGEFPILATGGQIGTARQFLWDKPSVLIGRKGTIDAPRFMDKPFWSVDTLFYTDVHHGYEAKFLFYVFMMIDWRSYNEASGVPSLNSKTIENIEFRMPPYDEQQAIAAVLSDMDAEIQTLESRLAKARAVKEGMMQNLLTGRVRLV